MEKERRKSSRAVSMTLSRELNNAQAAVMADLERFGWELKFVRHPLFQDAVPVVFDPKREHFVVLRPDGTLDEHPDFTIRK